MASRQRQHDREGRQRPPPPATPEPERTPALLDAVPAAPLPGVDPAHSRRLVASQRAKDKAQEKHDARQTAHRAGRVPSPLERMTDTANDEPAWLFEEINTHAIYDDGLHGGRELREDFAATIDRARQTVYTRRVLPALRTAHPKEAQCYDALFKPRGRHPVVTLAMEGAAAATVYLSLRTFRARLGTAIRFVVAQAPASVPERVAVYAAAHRTALRDPVRRAQRHEASLRPLMTWHRQKQGMGPAEVPL